GSRSLGVGGLTKFRMLVLCGTMVGVPNATAFLAVVRLPAPSTDTAFRARPYSVVTRTVPSALTARPRSYAALAPVNLDVLPGGAWEGRSTVAAYVSRQSEPTLNWYTASVPPLVAYNRVPSWLYASPMPMKFCAGLLLTVTN